MADVSPSQPSGGMPYKAEYAISPQTRKFWEKLFHGASITDTQLRQMNDQFIRNVWNQMNQVLQWALEQQKKRDREQKEERGG